MLKLYKRIDNILYYHEAWEDDSTVIEHFGVVGEQGEMRKHRISAGKSSRAMIKAILAPARALGYKTISDDDHAILIVGTLSMALVLMLIWTSVWSWKTN